VCERRISRLERRIAGDSPPAVSAEVAVEPPPAARPVESEPASRRNASPGVSSRRSPGTSLLSVVEDHGGARLRYRLLR
jgi:hypothetical protein